MSEIDETVKEFLVESLENLELLDRQLLMLESDPSNLTTINTIFRIVHTVKGTCGFFDYKKLESVSHVGENLLDSLRSERVKVTAEIITGLLKLCDTLRELLNNIEQQGSEGNGDYTSIVNILSALNEDASNQPTTTLAKEGDQPPSENIIHLSSEFVEDPSVTAEVPGNTQTSESDTDLESIFAAAQSEWNNEAIAHVQTSELPDNRPIPEVIEAKLADTPSSTFTLDNLPDNNALEKPTEVKKSEIAESSLRVEVSILDKLMNLVGELVLARNQILQFTKKQNDSEFVSTSQRLNLITSELQDGVMRTRMQPISTVWNKLPRVVRDMSHLCGKQVKLEMQGKETELDKTIIEAIKDPLTHIIRNSIDHGIETPERRTGSGKTSDGTLLMRAFHEGGQVVIEISDDGAGLNTDRIRSKAIEKNLLSSDKAQLMNEAEIHRLIFLPGFSTAEKITNISGRGVGMDVVRSNIERIGGAVDVASHLGKGSKFTIKIPLTLAIIPGLIVTTNDNRYAIPQVNLLELVRIEGEQIKKCIEQIHGSDFYRLRGKILPLVYLDEQLGILDVDASKNSKNSNIVSLVVVRADNHQFGLVVDAIHDTEEIVVKPLGRLLKGITALAGATIMGDGQVALILDIAGLARKAQIAKKEAATRNSDKTTNDVITESKTKMFVFEVGPNKRAAVPLEHVYRLEEFRTSALEHAGNHVVVQYRDGILPLVDLRAFFGLTPLDEGDHVRAFVYHNNGQYVGFIVQRIVDIVEQAVKIESPYRKAGLVGSGVIQGKVTDLLDLEEILRTMELGVEHEIQEVGAAL